MNYRLIILPLLILIYKPSDINAQDIINGSFFTFYQFGKISEKLTLDDDSTFSIFMTSAVGWSIISIGEGSWIQNEDTLKLVLMKSEVDSINMEIEVRNQPLILEYLIKKKGNRLKGPINFYNEEIPFFDRKRAFKKEKFIDLNKTNHLDTEK